MSAPENDPRLAAQTSRYHTWPRHRDQSVAEHTWQVMRILLAIWPECPRHILLHALTHDVGEGATGDVPYPNKANNDALKKAMDKAERAAHLAMCLPWSLPPPQELKEYEHRVFKTAEFIEMWEWALFEQAMGNAYAHTVEERCWTALGDLVNGLSIAHREKAQQYIERRRQCRR